MLCIVSIFLSELVSTITCSYYSYGSQVEGREKGGGDWTPLKKTLRADRLVPGSLSDVPGKVDLKLSEREFRSSRWWTRGWTLQELLAPAKVVFFVSKDDVSSLDSTTGPSQKENQQDQHLSLLASFGPDTESTVEWHPIGTRTELSYRIASITGIHIDILDDPEFLHITSIAQRMSWASNRVTSRPEDMAYCLMGLFDVHMPMLYGEGAEKAFLRLQEQIMASSDDQSLFAWRDEDASPDTHFGLLATSPRFFRGSSRIIPYQDWQTRPPYQMTNRGLQIGLPLVQGPAATPNMGRYWATLDCPVLPDYEDNCFLAICLERLPGSDQQFARVMANQFGHQRNYGAVNQIYVRQQQKKVLAHGSGIFPKHVLTMRRATFRRGNYRAVDVVVPHSAERRETHRHVGIADWLPARGPKVFRLGKAAWAQVAGAILFERVEDGERLLVRVGSAGLTKVGFDAVRQLPRYRTGLEEHEHLRRQVQDTFVPRQSGQFVELKHHRVQVNFTEPGVYLETMGMMVDIEIESISFADRTQPLPALSP